MMRARTPVIWGIACCCAATVGYAAWPVISKDYAGAQNDLNASVALLLAVFAVGYFQLRSHCRTLGLKAKASATQMEEMRANVAEAASQLRHAVRIVQVESIELRGLFRNRELVQNGNPDPTLRASPSLHNEMTRVFTALKETKARVNEACTQAQVAVQAVELQNHTLNDFERKRLRAAQPRWKTAGEFGHELQHEVRLRNIGAPACDLKATWEDQGIISVMLSSSTLVNTGEYLSLKIVFHEQRLQQFRFDLSYSDAVGERRTSHITMSEMSFEMEVEEV